MNELIGVPYKFHGRDHQGADCLGIVMLWYKKFLGVTIPEYFYTHTHENEPCTDTIEAGQVDGNWQKVSEMQYGDVLVFRIKGKATHIGVYIGNNDFLHCIAGKNSCIEHVDHWKHRIVSVFRWSTKTS